ncbi:MAG: chromosome segregation protein SMC [Bacteroidota bacterium]
MYLSKLEIVGFKSFAQKVNLVFDSGISAIVGPNGCGKTNIVDAIRWVLGEQRYSALRSDKMEDVIFNGTKARKALGMAEASLVIENTKGILPSEYTQVTVGRRVYRSGESEYLLNKTPCRLKDILDLFMDTGMGADAYSVIELKMIEVILSEKAEERRRLFEEAAGVTKYKHRRKAAYRKLDDVRADLQRVNDIVAEVQKAVNSLERQAKKAEQFNGLKERLKALEVDLMEREYTQLLDRIGPLGEKLGTLQSDRSRLDLDLTEEEARLDSFRTTLLEEEKRLAEAQRDVSLQREKTHQVEQRSAVASERISALRSSLARLAREREARILDIGQSSSARETLQAKITDLEQAVQKTAERQRMMQEDLRTFEGVLDTRAKAQQDFHERFIALVRRNAELEAEQDKRRVRLADLEGRAARATEETERYRGEMSRLENLIASLMDEDRQLRRAFSESETHFYNAERRRNEISARIEGIQRSALETHARIDHQRTRAEFLQGLIDRHEGLSEGVRFLADSSLWKGGKTLTVADAIHADERLRPALEAGLGEFAGYVIAANAAEAESAVSLLTTQDHGKATFICLDRLPEIHAALPSVSGAGVVGWAVELATYDPAYSQLFSYLLDRVLIVENVEAANRVAAGFPGVRCVTVNGEMEEGAGIRRGGSRRVDEGGMIGKREQINDLHNEVERLERTVESLTRRQEEAQRELDAIDLKVFGEAVKQIEKDMSGVEMRIAQVQFEKERAEDVIATNADVLSSIAEESAGLRAELESASPHLAAVESEKLGVDQAQSGLASELEGLEKEWNERSERLQEIGLEMVRCTNDLDNARADVARTDQFIEEAHAAISAVDVETRAALDTIGGLEDQIGEHDLELDRLRQELAALEGRRNEAETAAMSAREEIHRAELEIKDQRRTHDESLQILHGHEIQLHDLKNKAEQLRERAKEEFEMILDRKAYPADEFVDFAVLREEIPALREKIKTLGNINFAAFEEYSEEKKRWETLNVQRTDLLEAEKNLLATIEEINLTAQRLFLETFAKIRGNFIETFKSLFDPGDECDLKLEEEVDPLEGKIEIVAKPRGKRPTSIDLLSGGEKTLTAIALLFAIYLVKPSPFCILDEVDAPLDDANIERFSRILRKFSDNTQFIVVTHNKRTMEAANALYGITMEEEGVSKIVTVRFNQSGTAASAALAAG